jgi:plasmid maintenance system killer protein
MMKTYGFTLSTGIAAVLLSVSAGCSDENSSEQAYSGNLIVYDYINSGGMNKSIMPESSLANQIQEQQPETVRLATVENNRLRIEHKNISFHCAAKLEIEASIENTMIRITEKDAASSPTDRICPYNLSYEISLPHNGEYSLRINDNFPIRFTYDIDTDTTVIIKSGYPST